MWKGLGRSLEEVVATEGVPGAEAAGEVEATTAKMSVTVVTGQVILLGSAGNGMLTRTRTEIERSMKVAASFAMRKVTKRWTVPIAVATEEEGGEMSTIGEDPGLLSIGVTVAKGPDLVPTVDLDPSLPGLVLLGGKCKTRNSNILI